MWQNPDSFINVTDASARLGQQRKESEQVSESEEGEKGIDTYSYNIHKTPWQFTCCAHSSDVLIGMLISSRIC